ncbi:hypothetical protein R3P38DRAFT_2787412 [Favolaschia claudopus]|uniref:Uncharacterized protein n=1 Tax=Favolaschia claudopus TaxID=2862362 RepID=A0AAW0ANQ1_9AGAR
MTATHYAMVQVYSSDLAEFHLGHRSKLKGKTIPSHEVLFNSRKIWSQGLLWVENVLKRPKNAQEVACWPLVIYGYFFVSREFNFRYGQLPVFEDFRELGKPASNCGRRLTAGHAYVMSDFKIPDPIARPLTEVRRLTAPAPMESG